MTYSISARARCTSAKRTLPLSVDAVPGAVAWAALAAPAGFGVTKPITRLQAASASAETRNTQVKTRPQRGRAPDAEHSLAVRMLLRGSLHEPPAPTRWCRWGWRSSEPTPAAFVPLGAVFDGSDRTADCIRRATQGRTEACAGF